MIYFLLQKQQRFFITTKSLNQYPKFKAHTSDEIRPLEKYENNTVVSDDILLSKQACKIDLTFTRVRNQIIDIYYISQSDFHLTKKCYS